MGCGRPALRLRGGAIWDCFGARSGIREDGRERHRDEEEGFEERGFEGEGITREVGREEEREDEEDGSGECAMHNEMCTSL
jgi:hypothetical protein